ncbi:MAG: helix-turn-helix transcriptional regulator [Erysipelotrichaceae bacterium]|nr:helix-turn-helix transcriptional regulator [Erysipelotrichaceae bacterium]
MITFDPLWKTMEEKGVSQYALINKYHVSPGQITRLKRNSNVNTNTINTLCNILECDITDVISYTRDEK